MEPRFGCRAERFKHSMASHSCASAHFSPLVPKALRTIGRGCWWSRAPTIPDANRSTLRQDWRRSKWAPALSLPPEPPPKMSVWPWLWPEYLI